MAELKKSDKANLDNKRWRGFLLGLAIACSLFFVAMEYTTRPDLPDDEADYDEDMIEDLRLKVNREREDMIAVPSPQPPSPAVTEKVAEAEVPSSDVEKIAPNHGKNDDGGDGLLQSARTEKDAVASIPMNKTDEVLSFRVVQQIPEFPGGMAAFVKWLTDNLQYPAQAQQKKTEGRVVVSFIVNTNGSVSDIKVDQSAGDWRLDNEALRVMRRMPAWKPGVENDKPCRTMMAVPIVFAL